MQHWLRTRVRAGWISVWGTALVALAVVAVAPDVSAQTKAKAENVPEISFTSVPNFFKLPPDLYFGEGIGVATNSKGHVFVFTRSGDTRLFEFDANGTFVREIGAGLYGFEFATPGPRRPGGQRLGRRRRDEHGDQVQPRGARRDGARPTAGAGGGRRRQHAADRLRPRSTASAARPT